MPSLQTEDAYALDLPYAATELVCGSDDLQLGPLPRGLPLGAVRRSACP